MTLLGGCGGGASGHYAAMPYFDSNPRLCDLCRGGAEAGGGLASKGKVGGYGQCHGDEYSPERVACNSRVTKLILQGFCFQGCTSEHLTDRIRERVVAGARGSRMHTGETLEGW